MSILQMNIVENFEIKKCRILEELTEVCSDDIGKIHVSELLLRYYELSNPKQIFRDPWICSDAAAKQLYNASKKNVRKMIRSNLHCDQKFNIVKSNIHDHISPLTIEERTERRQFAQSENVYVRSSSNLSIQSNKSIDKLATHIVNNSLSRESLEKELSFISENLITTTLSNVQYTQTLNKIAVSMITRIILETERHLNENTGEENENDVKDIILLSNDSSNLSITRIEEIASNMVNQLYNKVYAHIFQND